MNMDDDKHDGNCQVNAVPEYALALFKNIIQGITQLAFDVGNISREYLYTSLSGNKYYGGLLFIHKIILHDRQ